MSNTSNPLEKTLFGHPRGMFILFSVEMWERFSYYGMRALLVLYLTDLTVNGGLGWTQKEALGLYGLYTSSVYLTPLIGGWLADRYLGQRLAIIIGGGLMVLGHGLMAIEANWALYSALVLLILGNGFFKPNISTMVGGLYKEGDPRRDGGFNIFYMGVNLGAMIAPIVCGALEDSFNYHYGFAAAGVGMLVGQIMFMASGDKIFGDVGKLKKKVKEKADAVKEKVPLTKEDRDRIAVIFVMSFFVIFFWAAFEQGGGYMTLYTRDYTDRMLFGWEVPVSWFQSLNATFILIFAPILAALWQYLGKRNKDFSTPIKFVFGLVLMSLAFVAMMGSVAFSETDANGEIVAQSSPMLFLVIAYLLQTLGELCLSPIGLSMVTRLAPVKLVAMFMGIWYLANAAANYVAAWVGTFSAELGPMSLFAWISAATLIAGLILFALSKKLVTMMHGK